MRKTNFLDSTDTESLRIRRCDRFDDCLVLESDWLDASQTEPALVSVGISKPLYRSDLFSRGCVVVSLCRCP